MYTKLEFLTNLKKLFYSLKKCIVEKLGIKIVNEGGIMKAKGNTLGSNIGYFFGILFFIVGGIMTNSGILGAAILAIIGIIIIYASSHHSKKARIKKLRELGHTPSE